MPSFADSAVIFVLALLLFGPKKLPELARYLGKLLGEFRRASAEFRLQMDDEFRAIEHADQQKKIEAIRAATPLNPLFSAEPNEASTTAPIEAAADSASTADHTLELTSGEAVEAPEPVPIASNGDLHLMPPATGLPVSRSASSNSMSAVFESIPHTSAEPETSPHG